VDRADRARSGRPSRLAGNEAAELRTGAGAIHGATSGVSVGSVISTITGGTGLSDIHCTSSGSCIMALDMSRQSDPALLWIDESGEMDARGSAAVVGGVLTARPVPDRMVYQTLRKLCPGLPWPFHAAHYGLTVSIALASQASRAEDPTRTNPRIEAAADAAMTMLRYFAPEDITSAEDEMTSGRLPAYDLLSRLNKILTKRVGTQGYSELHHMTLAAGRDQLVAGIREVLKAISDLKFGAFVLGLEEEPGTAGENRRARLDLPEPPATGTDRYFALLEGALCAGSRRARNEGFSDRGIKPIVLSLRVHNMRQLTAEDVDKVGRTAECGSGSFAPSEVRFYDRNAHSCLILADFICNRARRGINTAGKGLQERQGLIVDEIGVGVEIGWV